jgi:hypothetical protein
MTEIVPRFEFRIWGENLDREHQLLRVLAPASPPKESSETYLISSATDRCNAKIRSGLIDIKLLRRTERGLELWEPVLKAKFPLDGPTIATKIYPRLELEPSKIDSGRFSPTAFLDQIARDSRIEIVPVSKRRSQFQVEGCTAEFASIRIGGRPVDTVAVESTDPEALLPLLVRLGISNSPNQSYIREIKRIIGAPAQSAVGVN